MQYQLFFQTGAKNRTDFQTHATFGEVFQRSVQFLSANISEISAQLRTQLALLNSVLYIERLGTCNCGMSGGQIAMTTCSASQSGDESQACFVRFGFRPTKKCRYTAAQFMAELVSRKIGIYEFGIANMDILIDSVFSGNEALYQQFIGISIEGISAQAGCGTGAQLDTIGAACICESQIVLVQATSSPGRVATALIPGLGYSVVKLAEVPRWKLYFSTGQSDILLGVGIERYYDMHENASSKGYAGVDIILLEIDQRVIKGISLKQMLGQLCYSVTGSGNTTTLYCDGAVI